MVGRLLWPSFPRPSLTALSVAPSSSRILSDGDPSARRKAGTWRGGGRKQDDPADDLAWPGTRVSDVAGAEPSPQVHLLEDREDAGRRLAARLEPYRSAVPIVLGIPRGGVPVGYEIARRLGCELDVLLVRKVGAPGDPEYGLGAVAEGGVVVVDERRTRMAGWSREDLEPIIRRELEEVTARAVRYRGDRPPPELSGRTVIVVDDGVATGGTVETGIGVVRARKPRAIVAALGVAPPEALDHLRETADDVVVALVPRFLEAVGQWYRRFDPVDDREVVRLLESARSWTGANAPRGDAPGLG